MIAVHLPGDEVVAGFFHPAGGAAAGTAVLLVPPHGWDDQGAYRPRRAWAAHLAAEGFPALRIDLPAAGDSAGLPRDPDRLGAWTDAVARSLRWLRDEAGAERVAVVALGLGGLITLEAMRRGAEVDDLVLWGAPLTGRAALRELKAFSRLEASQTGEDLTQAPKGELRAGGHVLSADSAAAVGALDGVELARTVRPARALVLGRDGSAGESALAEAFRAGGAEVATDAGKGWGLATASSEQAREPTAIYVRVSEWLGEAASPGRSAPPPPGTPGAIVADGVRETPVRFAGGAGELFGVLAEPADGPSSGTAVFLNAGTLRHIGPNRMWTEAARRWAAQGVASFRVDLEGIGESDGDGTIYIDAAPLHLPAMQKQVAVVLDMLAARGLPQDFLMIGMCSGAYWAFQAALADPRVRRVATLNQRVFFWDPDAEPNRELGRFLRIFTPQGFRNLLIGQRRLLRLWRLVRWLATTPVRLAARRRNPTPPGDPLNDALETLIGRGQRFDLAFSLEEPLHDDLRRHDRFPDLADHGVVVHELPGISHTLKPVAAQEAAGALLDRIAAETFPPRVPA